MEPERIAAATALGRIAAGSAALVAPGLVEASWPDAVDCGTTLAARGSIPPLSRVAVAGIAGSAAVTGTWLARTLGVGAPAPHP